MHADVDEAEDEDADAGDQAVKLAQGDHTHTDENEEGTATGEVVEELEVELKEARVRLWIVAGLLEGHPDDGDAEHDHEHSTNEVVPSERRPRPENLVVFDAFRFPTYKVFWFLIIKKASINQKKIVLEYLLSPSIQRVI